MSIEQQELVQIVRSVVRQEVAPLSERVDRQTHEIGKLTKIITGDEEPDKGHVVRLDRIEQDQARDKAARRRAFILWGAVIGGACTLLAAIISGVFQLLGQG